VGLRETAEKHLAGILENKKRGFGWDITVTDPFGQPVSMVGFSNDISQIIDPETGQLVSGRSASVSLRISTLAAACFRLPIGVSDSSMRPWVIQFEDINGNPYRFKVSKSNPDRGLGVVTCLLEAYE